MTYKLISSSLLVLLASSVAGACGKKAEPKEETTPKEQAAPKENTATATVVTPPAKEPAADARPAATPTPDAQVEAALSAKPPIDLAKDFDSASEPMALLVAPTSHSITRSLRVGTSSSKWALAH